MLVYLIKDIYMRYAKIPNNWLYRILLRRCSSDGCLEHIREPFVGDVFRTIWTNSPSGSIVVPALRDGSCFSGSFSIYLLWILPHERLWLAYAKVTKMMNSMQMRFKRATTTYGIHLS